MDYKEKIQILRACSSKKGNRCSSCPAFGQGDRNCSRNAMKDAATALSTLQAENAQLRAELERMKRIMRDNGIMTIPSKYPGGPAEWNIPKPRGQKED